MEPRNQNAPRARHRLRRGGKHALWRDIRASIRRSKGRFFSIVGLMALGSFALVGLKVAGPDMRAAGAQYFQSLNAADLTVIADYGLTSADQELIAQVDDLRQVEYGYLKDVVIKGTDTSVRLQSAPEDVSLYEVVQGSMPEAADEVALDEKLADAYRLGDTFSVTEKADAQGNTVLTRTSFTVVGFVRSPEIVSKINHGESTAGSGELDAYGVVAPAAFDSDVHMTARLTFTDTEGLDPYSDAYDESVHEHKNELEDLLAQRPAARLAEVRADSQQKIDDGQAQVDDGRAELAQAAAELADARNQLDSGAAQITTAENTLTSQLAAAGDKLASGAAQIRSGRTQLAAGEAELARKEADLAAARQQIAAGQEAYDAAASELAAKEQEYHAGVAAYRQGAAELAQKQDAYGQGAAALEDARAELAAAQDAVDAAQAQITAASEKLEQGKQGYDAALDQAASARGQAEQACADATEKIDALDAQLAVPDLADEKRAQLEAARAEVAVQLEKAQAAAAAAADAEAQAQAARDAFMDETYNPGAQELAHKQAELDAQAAALKPKQEELAAKEQELAGAAQQLEEGRAALAQSKQQLDDAAAQLATGRSKLAASATQLAQARSQADDGAAQLAAGRQTLEQGADLLAQKEQELAAGQAELAQARAAGEAEIAAAKQELAEKEAAYEKARAAYEDERPGAEADLAQAEAELAEAREELAGLEQPSYTVSSRREVPGGDGYRVYQTVAEIIDALANVFPIFLYFVAALVTFTTMTRMVEEERINSGTLKALGYSDRDVMLKFVVYGFAASTLGSLLGIAAGHTVLPWIVYAAYGAKFTLPAITLTFDPAVSAVALALGYASAVLPAALSAKQELAARPAELLLPKPPAAGSKILLEHVRPLWRRLSFTQKVTARNLFRYKKRMLMTIFGVAGAVVLLVAGFGTQYSISGISDEQFGRLVSYDMIVAESPTATSTELDALASRLAEKDVARSLPLYYENVTREAGARMDTQDITMIVPDDLAELADYITLQVRATGEPITLTDDSVVLSERLAELLGVGPGDTFTVTDATGTERTLAVTDVCEMYLGHFLFVGKGAYRRAFHAPYEKNAYLVTLANGSADAVNAAACSFMELPAVKGIQQNTSLKAEIATIVDSLNMIMVVLIAVASMLAVVILYNLTTINVSERLRELSTIKVLGFYDNEVTMYIYRETIILTLIGIVAGWVMGVWFRNYIITVVPPDNVMFDPGFAVYVFVIPLVIVGVITVALGFAVNRRLVKVDMLEALKSVE